ncbi:hypothetical protein H4I96_00420 [Botrytis cinerea]
MEGMVMITPLHTVFVWPDFFLFQPVLDKHVRQSSSTFKMSSQDSTPKSPRLHHIDTSSNGGVSGPFWDSNERCFWLMNNRQVYTHPENYSGSSACATIASANPDSAYPSGWSRGQRTRSLSGSDNSPNSASHESKRIRPESLGSAPPKNAESKQPLRQGTPEQQRKFPQYDLSNLPPPPPFPPQRSHSVRFSPDISYSDDPVKKHNPGASVPSFPQRSQSVRISNEHDQGFTRSRNPSPSSPPSSSSHPHHKPLPTRPQSFPASTSTSTHHPHQHHQIHPQNPPPLSPPTTARIPQPPATPHPTTSATPNTKTKIFPLPPPHPPPIPTPNPPPTHTTAPPLPATATNPNVSAHTTAASNTTTTPIPTSPTRKKRNSEDRNARVNGRPTSRRNTRKL